MYLTCRPQVDTQPTNETHNQTHILSHSENIQMFSLNNIGHTVQYIIKSMFIWTIDLTSNQTMCLDILSDTNPDI